MKLDFLSNISENGKYRDVISNNLVRLYDFDTTEALKLAGIIQAKIIHENCILDIGILDFIEGLNCRLLLEKGEDDYGVLKYNKSTFKCVLTVTAYTQMVNYIRDAKRSGYQWLCLTSKDDIDFLFSASGTW